MAKKNVSAKNVNELNVGQFLTLLCATQKLKTPTNEKLHSGTIKLFEQFKPAGKVQGFNNCSGQDRNKIFDSFGAVVKFQSVAIKLEKVQGSKGATYRTMNCLGAWK